MAYQTWKFEILEKFCSDVFDIIGFSDLFQIHGKPPFQIKGGLLSSVDQKGHQFFHKCVGETEFTQDPCSFQGKALHFLFAFF